MCTVCGCGQATLETPEHVTVNEQTGDMHFGEGVACVSLPNVSQERTITLETDVLSANNTIAKRNRNHFIAHNVSAFNLVSSPGSGKTTLLCTTIEALKNNDTNLAIGVIEGDQQTSNDADRIRATDVPTIQVNTGKGCHLDAMMIEHAFNALPIHSQQHTHTDSHDHSHDHAHHHDKTLLFIENVGNLVCPAMWDLGEKAKVAILSVTEGEDKPLKYPDMFAAADMMLLNKIDLLPYLNFDVEKCIQYAKQVNPTIQILPISATTGEGMSEWINWLLAR
ncbi:MAG: hydrogenase nickel incorporation protein HypB [Gammaproteobacteria bacterium]|nr:hydrogenase nickel incorporation protein HypB [Gammaproteobacteria bacterium]